MSKIKEWARKLNNRSYRQEITLSERVQAKEDGVVIIFGYLDDTVEIRGAIDDTILAWKGMTLRISDRLDVFDEYYTPEFFPEFSIADITKMRRIEALWSPKDENGCVWASWCYLTDIPHETFDILNGDVLYCRGIVFNLEEVVRPSHQSTNDKL